MADLALSFKNLPEDELYLILQILQGIPSSQQPGEARVAVLILKLKGIFQMGEITVSDTEANLSAKVTALDSEGHETTFDEMPTWATSDDSVAVCQPSDDGYSCTFVIGQPGSAVITVTGVETSTGQRTEIVSTGLINVTAGDAVVGSVEFTVGAAPPVEPPVDGGEQPPEATQLPA